MISDRLVNSWLPNLPIVFLPVFNNNVEKERRSLRTVEKKPFGYPLEVLEKISQTFGKKLQPVGILYAPIVSVEKILPVKQKTIRVCFRMRGQNS